MSPSRKPDAARPGHETAGLARKPLGRAASSVEHSGMVPGSKRGRPGPNAEMGQVVENSALICNILRSKEKRERIFAYLKRLKKKGCHPCNRPRIIAQGLHYPQVAVELVIQNSPEAIEEWFREFRLGLTRADDAVQKYWERRIA